MQKSPMRRLPVREKRIGTGVRKGMLHINPKPTYGLDAAVNHPGISLSRQGHSQGAKKKIPAESIDIVCWQIST